MRKSKKVIHAFTRKLKFTTRLMVVQNFLSAALICLTLASFSVSGYTQANKGELVKTDYDAKKNVTQLTFNPITIASRKLEELRLGAVTAYPGKEKTRPKEIVLVFLSLSPTEMNKYEAARKLTVVADGERIAIGETQRTTQAQGGLYIESLMITISTDLFIRIVWSKELILKLGITVVELSPAHITTLRAAASYMTEK